MASKKSAVNEAKKRIKDKLKDINEQAATLHNAIDETKIEVEKIAEALLQEKSKTKFFQKSPEVNQKLEETLNRLLLIKDAIYSLDEDSSSSSSSEEECEDDDTHSERSTITVMSTTTTINEECSPTRQRAVNAEAASTSDACQQIQNNLKTKKDIQVEEKPSPRASPINKQNASSTPVAIPEQRSSPLLKQRTKSDISSISSSQGVGTMPRSSPSPIKKTARLSSCASMSPLLPRVLTDDVKVPSPVIRHDTAQMVIITEIENPWSFYVQVNNPAYDNFMEDLCLHFMKQATQGYKGGISNIPSIGCYCCAKSPDDDTWYRAKITSVQAVEFNESTVDTSESMMSSYDDPVLNNIQASVFMIDEGIVADLPLRHIRPLEQRFSYLPAQAIHCMLAGVAPLDYGEADLQYDCIPWSGESTDWFTQTIKSEHFFTGFIHKPNKNDWRMPIDLYACTDDLNTDSTSFPAIDTNIGYMMLLVDMASPFAVVKSHLEGHYGEISLLSYVSKSRQPWQLTLELPDKAPSDADEQFNIVETNETVPKNGSIAPAKLQENEVKVDKVAHAAEDRATKNNVNDSIAQPAGEAVGPEVAQSTESNNTGIYSGALYETEQATQEAAVKETSVPEKLRPKKELPFATFENRYKEKEFVVGKEGFCPVIVSNVKDPGSFYVHLLTPDVILFDAVLEEIDEFYSNNQYPVHKDRLKIGDAVITKFSEDGKWSRGLISHLRIPDRGDSPREEPLSPGSKFEYEIVHVDFGSSEWVKHDAIQPVVEKFFELPMETLPCCLADIEPMGISRDVSTSSSASGTDNDPKSPLSLKLKVNNEKPASKKKEKVIELAAGTEDFSDVFDTVGSNMSPYRAAKWSQEAIARFTELAVDGLQRIASLKDGLSKQRLPNEPWHVYLYNTNNDAEIFINQVLVDEALAVSDVYTKATEDRTADQVVTKKIVVTEEELERTVAADPGTKNSSQAPGTAEPSLESATSPASPVSPTSPISPTRLIMNAWNPMKDDFMSTKNAYCIDTDDPSVATTGYAEPKRNICRNFLTRSGCRRGDLCHFEHARPGDLPKGKLEVFSTKDQDFSNLPDVGKMYLTEVTSLISPVHFYVRFPFGIEPIDDIKKRVGSDATKFDGTDELIELQERMNRTYSKIAYRSSDLRSIGEGELIATKFSDDGNWYRSRVLEDLDDKYRVFFIDYGNVEIVPQSDTRRIIPEFLYLEHQAFEVYLANVELKTTIVDEESMMVEATECFENLLGDGMLMCRVMSKAINGTLYLELYDKRTKANINTGMLKTQYFMETETALSKPWDMSKLIAVNTKINHLIPG